MPVVPALSDPSRLIGEAQAALERGEWQRAYERLREADAAERLAGPKLALLAEVAYGAGHLDVTIESWERVHAQAIEAGDAMQAAGAAVRVAMHLLFDTALMAPVRGWLSRAERLLEGKDTTPIHAWIAVVRGYERLLSGDFDTAGQWARKGVAIGARLDPAAAAVARIAQARSMVLAGEVSEGLSLLNEAAVATVSGELDLLFTGLVYCELVCAFQALAQYDQAEEWTTAMERWSKGKPIGSLHGRCRVHRAEILRLRGGLLEAENEAQRACEELRPFLRRELGWPLAELGRIRLLRGDVQGAEEVLLAAHTAGWDPQPGLALVYLAKGNAAGAARAIRDALTQPVHVPSKEYPPNAQLRRVRLLEAQVSIAIASSDLGLARTAADELGRIASLFQSKALLATASLAVGRVGVAEGKFSVGRIDLEQAVRLWHEIGAPYETAVSHMQLGHLSRMEADEARAQIEFRVARALFDQVGALSMSAMAAQAGAGSPPSNEQADPGGPVEHAGAVGAAHAQAQLFLREGDYWCVSFEKKTVRLRDMKGLRYLARLLARPGRDFHVLELIAAETGGEAATNMDAEVELTAVMGWDAGVLLDEKAKAAYRRRLAEISEDLDASLATGNHDRAAQAEAERDFLMRELARAVGIGGQDRRAASTSERARASVTRAIRHAMARVSATHRELGQHLERTVRTGTSCAYLQYSKEVVWTVSLDDQAPGT